MFVAAPAFLAREVIDFSEEEFGHVRRKHALIVLGKDAVVEAAFGKFAVQKPEPKQIIGELLAKEPFAAHAVKGGQHTRLEQLLRRNAVAPDVGIKFVKQRRELLQNRVHAALDGAQRMVGGHGGVEVDDRQKVRLSLRFSTHEFQTPPHSFCSNVFQQPARSGIQ